MVLAKMFSLKTFAIVNIILIIFNFLMLIRLPESPRWLVAFKSNESAAIACLLWLYDNEEVRVTYTLIVQSN